MSDAINDYSKLTLEQIIQDQTRFLKAGTDETITILISAKHTVDGKQRIRVPANVYKVPGEFEIEGNLCLPVVDGNRVIR